MLALRAGREPAMSETVRCTQQVALEAADRLLTVLAG
jgi:hypothetical protein